MKIRELNKNVTLSNEDIAVLLDSIKKFFDNFKLDNLSSAKLILSLHESLLTWQGYFGTEQCVHITAMRSFFHPRIVITLEGKKINPLLKMVGEEYNELFAVELPSRGILPAYTYQDGVNRLTLTPAEQSNFFAKFLIASLLGIIIGFACCFLPDAIQKFITSSIIKPCTSLFLNLLNLVSVPLVFISIICSITLSSSDTTKQKGMRTVFVLFLLSPIVILSIHGILMSHFLDFQNFTSSSISSTAFSYVIKTLYNMFPKDIVSPLIERNMLQVAFLAIACGLLIVSSGNKASQIKSFLFQVEYLLRKAFNWVYSLMIPFTFICIINLVLNANKAIFTQFVGMFSVTLIFFLCATCLWLIIYSVKNKKSPFVLLSAMKPALLLGVMTGSRWACFEQIQNGAEKLEIPKPIVRQTVSLGLVFHQPILAGWLMTALFFFAIYENVPVSTDWFFTSIVSIIIMSYGNSTSGIAPGFFPQLGLSPEAIVLIMFCDTFVTKLRCVFETTCLVSLIGTGIPQKSTNRD